MLVVLVPVLSVSPVIMTNTLFAFVMNVQFGTEVMMKEYSHFFMILSEPPWPKADIGVKGPLGDDWPRFFPLVLEREVEMVEDCVHYSAGALRLGADGEWWYERGFGFGGAGRDGLASTTGRLRCRSATRNTVHSTYRGSSRIAPESTDFRTTNTA